MINFLPLIFCGRVLPRCEHENFAPSDYKTDCFPPSGASERYQKSVAVRRQHKTALSFPEAAVISVVQTGESAWSLWESGDRQTALRE